MNPEKKAKAKVTNSFHSYRDRRLAGCIYWS